LLNSSENAIKTPHTENKNIHFFYRHTFGNIKNKTFFESFPNPPKRAKHYPISDLDPCLFDQNHRTSPIEHEYRSLRTASNVTLTICISNTPEAIKTFNPNYVLLQIQNHHQPINIPTSMAQAFLMDYT
jgi:hypothetical protein